MVACLLFLVEGVPIRRVVTYEEITVNGGYCDTCSFTYVAVRVAFKSAEGSCVFVLLGGLWGS